MCCAALVQVRLISYCPKHCTAHPELAGVQMIKEGEEEDRGDDGNGLWNSQPFRQPPSVPVPDCPAGSVRAQPLQVCNHPPFASILLPLNLP
jgi:hypothetical protein